MRNNKTNSFFMEFLKKYWYILLGIIIALPYLVQFFKKMGIKYQVDDIKNDMSLNSQINAQDNIFIQLNKADQILRNYGITTARKKEFQADVKNFAYHLGTGVGLEFWQMWTENDKEASKILIKWIRHLPKFAELYYHCYTESKNLNTDVLKYLDKAELARVRNTQKLYNINFF